MSSMIRNESRQVILLLVLRCVNTLPEAASCVPERQELAGFLLLAAVAMDTIASWMGTVL